jgi:hypothetical protein
MQACKSGGSSFEGRCTKQNKQNHIYLRLATVRNVDVAWCSQEIWAKKNSTVCSVDLKMFASSSCTVFFVVHLIWWKTRLTDEHDDSIGPVCFFSYLEFEWQKKPEITTDFFHWKLLINPSNTALIHSNANKYVLESNTYVHYCSLLIHSNLDNVI